MASIDLKFAAVLIALGLTAGIHLALMYKVRSDLVEIQQDLDELLQDLNEQN